MPPKTNIFSKDVEFLLIDLIESRPILWDISSELYKRIDLKDAAWEEVACSLGPHFSGSIVASRFKSMRDTFMSNFRRVKESKRSGKGTADIYIPKWYLYNRLKFLQKTLVQSTSISNITISSEKLDAPMSQIEQVSNELTQCLPEKEVVIDESPVLNVYNDSGKKFMIRSTEESSDNSIDLSISSFASTPASFGLQSLQPVSTSIEATASASKMQGTENQMYIKRGSAKRKSDNFMEEAVSAIKTLCQQESINSHESNSSVSTDSAHTLGMFIAARLREMMPDQRKQCENEILKLLYQF